MAKGFQKNRAHQEKTALLGKPLMRRSKKRCELCDALGEAMSVMEVEPAQELLDTVYLSPQTLDWLGD